MPHKMQLERETLRDGKKESETSQSQECDLDTGSPPKVSVLVMDSRCSWVVCGANFVILFFGAAFGRALSMNFLDFVRIFDASITMTSVSFTLHLLTISIASMLVTNLIVPITGERVACIGGAVGNFICTIGIGMAPNIGIFVLFMTIKGFCAGMCFVPSIAMISQYFDKRRSLATALANCGLSAGAMGAPPLVEFLQEMYGLRGTYLIIAALEMNSVAAAMLLRPISRYEKVINGREDHLGAEEKDGFAAVPISDNGDVESAIKISMEVLPEEKDEDISTSDNIGPSDKREATEPETICGSGRDEKLRSSKEYLASTGKLQSSGSSMNLSFCDDDESDTVYESDTETHHLLLVNDAGPRMRSASEADGSSRYLPRLSPPRPHTRCSMDMVTGKRVDGVYYLSSSYEDKKTRRNGGSHTEVPDVNIFISREDSRSKCWITTPLNGDDGTHHSSPYDMGNSHRYKKSRSSRDNLPRIPSSPVNNSKLNKARKRDSMFKSSTWSMVSAPLSDFAIDVEVCALESEHRAKADEGNEQAKEPVVTAEKVCKSENLCWKAMMVLHTVFNIKLLRTWSLRILLMSSVTGTLVQYLATYLPAIAVKQGVKAEQVSLLLTVGGAVDLGSRIAIGAFTDTHILTPTQIVAIAQFTIGTACHFTHLYTSFELLMFLSVVTGVFGGTRLSLSTLLTIQFMGVERFIKALGFQAMFGTLSLAAHHPLLSSILEKTGSFAPPLHYVGVAMYISSALLLMEPLAKRLDKQRMDD